MKKTGIGITCLVLSSFFLLPILPGCSPADLLGAPKSTTSTTTTTTTTLPAQSDSLAGAWDWYQTKLYTKNNSGEWVYNSTVTPSSDLELAKYLFETDGKITYRIKFKNKPWSRHPGTHTTSGSTLTMKWQDGSADSVREFSFDNHELLLAYLSSATIKAVEYYKKTDDDLYESNNTKETAFDMTATTTTQAYLLSQWCGQGKLTSTDGTDWFKFDLERWGGYKPGMYHQTDIKFKITEGTGISYMITNGTDVQLAQGTDASATAGFSIGGETGSRVFYVKITGTGAYNFSIDITPPYTVYSNTTKSTAQALAAGTDLTGNCAATQELWFSISVPSEKKATFTFEQTGMLEVPMNSTIGIYGDGDEALESKTGGSNTVLTRVLQSGTYFIKLTLGNNVDTATSFKFTWTAADIPAETISGTLSTTQLNITCPDMMSFMGSGSFTINNTGSDCSFTITESGDTTFTGAVNVSPSTGTIAAGATKTINVSATTFSSSSGTLTVTLNGSTLNHTMILPVSLDVQYSSSGSSGSF